MSRLLLLPNGMSDHALRGWLQLLIQSRLFNFVVARAVPVMLKTVGSHGYGTYFIFGCFCACMVVIAWFFVPETKGVSLERMDELFGVASFGDIEDVGMAAQHGGLGKAVEEVDRTEDVRTFGKA